MAYEANQIRLCNWLFEKSNVILRPLTSKLKDVKNKFDDEKNETVRRTSVAYEATSNWKLNCLKEQNKKVIQYLKRDWQRKQEVLVYNLRNFRNIKIHFKMKSF